MTARLRHVTALGRARKAAARLARANDGNTVLEFAMIAPAFFVLMMGTANLGQMVYAKVLLNGAIDQAARTSATESGDTTAADNTVRKIMGPVLPGTDDSSYTITRYSYYDFSDVARPEKITDTNNNGVCNTGETYFDENGNGSWDADVRKTGQGGASDVVVYQVSVRYQPLFKVPLMPNQWSQFTLTSKAVKKNQPFQTQSAYSTTTRSCT